MNTEVCKQIIKYSKVIKIPENRLVTEVKKSNHYIYVMLSGGLGIANELPDSLAVIKKED